MCAGFPEPLADTRTIAILGAYGNAGQALARVLLELTPWRVRLCARDGHRLSTLAYQLSETFGSPWIQTAVFDAQSLESTRAAVQGTGACIVALPTDDISRTNITEACMKEGVHSIDIGLGRSATDPESPPPNAARVTMVREAGLIPGLPAMMVKTAADHFDQLEDVAVAETVTLDAEDVAEATVQELLASLELKGEVCQEGRWQKPVRGGARKFDFGPAFGTRTAYPANLSELRPLPAELGLQSLGYYAAGFGGFADLWLVAILAFHLNRDESRLAWAVRRFKGALARQKATAPPGFVLRLEGRGRREGRNQQLALTVSHEDPYRATALAVLACMRQLLSDDSMPEGLHRMAAVIDHQWALADLDELGLALRWQWDSHVDQST